MRGTDGFGIIDASLNSNIFYATNMAEWQEIQRTFDWETPITEMSFTATTWLKKYHTTYEKLYTAILEDTLYEANEDDYFLMHHRKWSVWHNKIENNHPYYGDKFFLMQNWTDKKFHWWGIVEWISEEKSDTYMLLQFLERHVSTLNKVPAILTALKARGFSLWVIVIGDKKWNILMYSDWDRSMYINFTDDSLKKIDWFRSTEKAREHDTVGYMFFDMQWNVKSHKFTKLNELKPPKTYWTSRSHGAWQGSSGSGYTHGGYLTPPISTTTKADMPTGSQTSFFNSQTPKKDTEVSSSNYYAGADDYYKNIEASIVGFNADGVFVGNENTYKLPLAYKLWGEVFDKFWAIFGRDLILQNEAAVFLVNKYIWSDEVFSSLTGDMVLKPSADTYNKILNRYLALSRIVKNVLVGKWVPPIIYDTHLEEVRAFISSLNEYNETKN